MTNSQARTPPQEADCLAVLDRFVALVTLFLMMPLAIVVAIVIVIDSGFPSSLCRSVSACTGDDFGC